MLKTAEEAFWVCPGCKTRYELPTGIRIMAIVPKWDYCPKCLIYRDTGKKFSIRCNMGLPSKEGNGNKS